VLAALLAAMAWPGGADFHPVRLLLVEPWAAANLEHHTGLHPTLGGTLVAAALLLWLLSPAVQRAFALSDLDAVRASLPPLSDEPVKDDH
jgi:ABC-type phosphate transport system permease subunit